MRHQEASWSFLPQDLEQLDRLLLTFLDATSARCALLVDRSGQLLTFAGDGLTFDGTTFASLAAADFGASDQLAQLLGENEFKSLYHQGDNLDALIAGWHPGLLLPKPMKKIPLLPLNKVDPTILNEFYALLRRTGSVRAGRGAGSRSCS